MKRPTCVFIVGALLSALLIAGCAAEEGESGSSTASAVAAGEMPSVVNMTEEDAREAVLAVAPNAKIEVTAKQDAGDEGVVLEQDPSVGQKIDGIVTLSVSTGSVEVPDVIGQSMGKARKSLESAGFKVAINEVADPGADDGTVVGQRPAAGSRNEAKVTLDVARKDAATYLSDMEPVESEGLRIATGDVVTDGKTYTRAVILTEAWGEQRWVSYNLGRGFTQFDAVVGISDLASADTRASIEIQAEDGRVLYSEDDIKLGPPAEIDALDVSDVLRLTIYVTLNGSKPLLVLGDARLSNPR